MKSALDRYLDAHAFDLQSTYSRSSAIIQTWTGCGFLLMGVGLVVGAAASGIEGLAYGASGPVTAGLVNLVTGMVMRRKAESQAGLVVSKEARGLIGALRLEANPWNLLWGRPRPRRLVGRMNLNRERALTQGAREGLEACASAALRTEGALALPTAPRPTLSRQRGPLLHAVTAAMTEAFHHAAIANDRPETAHLAIGRLSELAVKLGELADRVEAIVRVPTLEDRLAGSAPLDDALETLRTYAEAERELA